MNHLPPEPRSLIAKFRFATVVQGTVVLALAVGVFVPALHRLSRRAAERREEAKSEVIDAGVNNIARLLAMELGMGFLPNLWDGAADLQRTQRALDAGTALSESEQLELTLWDKDLTVRLADRVKRLNERIAEKISYNGVLVDLVIVMPHDDPRDDRNAPFVFPLDHMNLSQMGSEEMIALGQYRRLTKVTGERGIVQPDVPPQDPGFVMVAHLTKQAQRLQGQAYIMPIRREGVPYGYAGMVVKTELIAQQFDHTWQDFWNGLESSLIALGLLTLLVLAAGAVFITLLAARLIRPLQGMREALAHVRADPQRGIDPADLREASARLERIRADPLDEIGALRTTFVEMSDSLAATLAQKAEALQHLKESTQQLARADRLKLVGTLTYGLAHNLNNALAPIANVANAAMLRHSEDQKLKQMMTMVLNSVHRSADIVGRLRDLTRLGSGETVAVEINRVLDETLESMRRPMQTAGINLQRDLGEVPLIQGNPVELWEVFANLLVNAREAIQRGSKPGPHTISIRSYTAAGAVCVEIQDNGPGMTDEVRARALEAWFSTKPEGEASGIGLWITQRIVNEHGGTLQLESTPGEGTCIKVTLRGMEPANS